MLDILTQKYQSAVDQDIWNYNDSNDPAVLVSPSKDIVIEWTDSGYFEVKKDKITFNDCVNGHTYSLRKDETRSYRRDSSREDWRKFQELFIDASNTKLFRIDAPILREEITINNNDWEYTKVARPGASIGKISNQHFMDPSIIEQFMEDIIDPYYYVIAGAIKVANNTPGLPGFPPIAIPKISIRHANRDNQGYFFVKNFDQWGQSPEVVIDTCIKLGQLIMRDLGTSSSEFIDQWTTKATNKWGSLL